MLTLANEIKEIGARQANKISLLLISFGILWGLGSLYILTRNILWDQVDATAKRSGGHICGICEAMDKEWIIHPLILLPNFQDTEYTLNQKPICGTVSTEARVLGSGIKK